MSLGSGTSSRPGHDGLALVAAGAGMMWAVEIVDLVAGDLDSHGIRPRHVDGLLGILAAPFLHQGFAHLVGNTLPFVVLGPLVALGGLVELDHAPLGVDRDDAVERRVDDGALERLAHAPGLVGPA